MGKTVTGLQTVITTGNKKLGNVLNVSTSPVIGCGDVPCRKGCYAVKIAAFHKNVARAWRNNYRLAHTHPDVYFGDIAKAIERRKPELFRWHVSGEILGQWYLDRMNKIALQFPTVKFLCFTKQFGLDYSAVPSNLNIVFSIWPGWKLPTNTTFPRAYMQDGTETRVPPDAKECPGNCAVCQKCWHLGKGQSVVFHKH